MVAPTSVPLTVSAPPALRTISVAVAPGLTFKHLYSVTKAFDAICPGPIFETPAATVLVVQSDLSQHFPSQNFDKF